MKNLKKIFVIIPLFSLILFTTSVCAQQIEEKVSFNTEVKTDFVIQYFKVKEISNTLYFKFLVLENRVNTVYVLESSTDGIGFDSVKEKEGFKSPNNIPLLYCYSVDLTSINAKAYRIKRISTDGNDYSKVIYTNSYVTTSLSAQLEE